MPRKDTNIEKHAKLIIKYRKMRVRKKEKNEDIIKYSLLKDNARAQETEVADRARLSKKRARWDSNPRPLTEIPHAFSHFCTREKEVSGARTISGLLIGRNL
jgi:hypothetical protein